MVRNSSGIEEIKARRSAFGPEVQRGVRAELDMMLADPIFAQSARCKRFLTYIVQSTLSGNADQLKERTIGISVFDRANDYHTGDDSIVRVTANEVRKRIDQFYRESGDAHPIQIELPKGAYVPEFKIQPSRRNRKAEEEAPPLDSSHQVVTSVETPGPQERIPTIPVTSNPGPGDEPEIGARVAAVRRPARGRLVYFGALILLIASGATIFGVGKFSTQRAVPQVWDAFLHAKAPILICIDTHNLHAPSTASSPNEQKFVDLVLYKQIISLDDAAVLSSMAAALGKRGIPFRVVAAEQISLTEFRRQPVILIGGIDNRWTIRLAQSLRYRIEIENPPGSGSGKEPIASIVDSEHPEATPWTVDMSVPYPAWKNDYAIVARMDDSTTGVPVLIEAGLGNDGSIAASELILSGALESQLKADVNCRGKANFETIVGTSLIDTRPGPPRILRMKCW
jgi:hypothetical protein